MTDDKSKDTANAQERPEETPAAPKAEPKSNFAKAAQDKSPKGAAATKARGGRGWIWLLLFAALIGGIGAWRWLNWPQLQSRLAQLDFLPFGRDAETEVAATEVPPTPGEPVEPPPQQQEQQQPDLAPDTDAAALEAQRQANAALQNQLRQQSHVINQLQQQLATLQRDVTAQGSRLSELGNVSRSDWQLAEADYLLRLANQRLLLERDSRAALGLLEQVDNILRGTNLPDLYGVRQQLANDITALKLVENIDREGLYARLRALEDRLIRVNIQPEFDLATLDAAATKPEEDSAAASAWRRSWDNFTQFMRDAVRIRDGDIDPVLLSPQSEARFRQSLRLNMEQAELALLRGDSNVYSDSLNRARQLLLEYGVASKQRDLLAGELQELRREKIEADLPSLAASQSALHNYIEQLHKTETQGGDNQ